jgi:RNA polymerase sigma-70 factor (ECF subfamily)
LAARFEADRPHLRAVAYRMLGSLDDAEDAVQTVWLKVSRVDITDVRNLTGWFTTVIARECLDQLRARRRRHEIPLSSTDEPASPSIASEQEAILAESVGRALLVVLDRLSPAQRIAYVLHDLFAVSFDEVAQVLDRSPGAAKKLASRARERLHGQPPPDQPLTAQHLRIARSFLVASRGGNLPQLLDLLAPDVIRRVDRILVPDDVELEISGAQRVAKETRRFAARARTGEVALLDGEPGIVLAPAGQVLAVLRLEISGGRIQVIDIVGDPDRLAAITITVPA